MKLSLILFALILGVYLYHGHTLPHMVIVALCAIPVLSLVTAYTQHSHERKAP